MDNTLGLKEWFDLDVWTCDLKTNRNHLLIEGTTYLVQPLHQDCHWSSEGVKRYWADNTLGLKEWFDLDLWTCEMKINRDHLLLKGNPCTKFCIDQVKGSKDIERTTHWAEKSGLTLTFKHVIWKSIGIIYLLSTTTAPNLVLIKWRSQKILSRQHTGLSRQHTGLKRVVWPWHFNMWPENL